MSTKPEVTATEAREAGYPIYGLDEAIKIAQAVYELGGSRAIVKREMLAKHLKYAESGPSFVQRIGSAKMFGLIDGRGGYELTELGKRYFLPASETDKGEAALLALQKPAVFGKIFARFHGQKLPPNPILGNIMHTEGKVPASWKDRTASLFVKSATAIGAIDAQGALKQDAPAAGDAGNGEDQQPPQLSLSSGSTDTKDGKPLTGTHTHTLPLANNRKVTINAPLDITASEIARLNKWAEVTLLLDWTNQGAE